MALETWNWDATSTSNDAKLNLQGSIWQVAVSSTHHKTKFTSTSSCVIPKCQSCELAWARQRSPKVKKVQSNLDSEGAISCNRLEVGDFVSTDQFVCRTPGQLPSGYGCDGRKCRFHGGTIYNDAASGLICFENQVSLGASETIMGK